MKKAQAVWGVLVALMAIGTACGGQGATLLPETPAQTIPVIPTRTAQPVPTPLPSDTPSPTNTPTPTPRHTATPTPVPRPTPLPDMLLHPAGAGLNLPDGFVGEVWLEDIRFPTAFAFDGQGRLYIATEGGDILRVNDAVNGEPPTDVLTIASGIEVPLGLAFFDGALYISSRGEITRLTDDDGDGDPETSRTIIGDLPVQGFHQNNGPAIGPDGKLYVPIGSTCDACGQEDVRNASVMRFNLDGSNPEVYARGLRNVYQLAFHPADGTLWAADNGRDDQGYAVPEELNLIVEGGVYGWPDCWGDGGGRRCEGTIPPVVDLPSRSSADGLVFYTGGQFPEEYSNNIFITLWGAGDGSTGKNVVRIELTKTEGRYAARVSNFATGFRHPLPIIVAPDGSLLIGDHGADRILRIRYAGS
ncbi:MAG: PQQ-dependent sugar dehydrogenase [Chloroflexi bacterium]|nr:PQQ-dependent sugar dehydrogenase [Chloroflexota bacterium]